MAEGVGGTRGVVLRFGTVDGSGLLTGAGRGFAWRFGVVEAAVLTSFGAGARLEAAFARVVRAVGRFAAALGRLAEAALRWAAAFGPAETTFREREDVDFARAALGLAFGLDGLVLALLAGRLDAVERATG